MRILINLPEHLGAWNYINDTLNVTDLTWDLVMPLSTGSSDTHTGIRNN
jgi:hypothetical protein